VRADDKGVEVCEEAGACAETDAGAETTDAGTDIDEATDGDEDEDVAGTSTGADVGEAPGGVGEMGRVTKCLRNFSRARRL